MSNRTRFFAAVLFVIAMSSIAAAEDVLVKNLPIPDGASDVSFMKRRGDVRFKVTTDFKATGEWYAKQLGAQRWSKSGKDNLQKTFWVQKFAKDKMSLEVRVDGRAGGSEVRLTPAGLKWDEDLAPHAKELPIPEDATDVEFEDFFERIEFNSPSKVKTLADSLSEKLEQLGWAKSGTDRVNDRSATLERTKGQSSVTITIRSEDSGSTVSMGTEGMNWDGIKQANETKKKTEKKVAANTPSKTNREEESPAPPPRKDRPKQGIADLPKLPNEGTVTLNGKASKLTSVIAYEVYSRGHWSTKILATEKPINQAALLAKIKKAGKDDYGQPAEGLSLSPPYVQVGLDEDDRPESMSLRAEDTPGGASGSDLEGTALVEDGRARGTVKMKKPGDFFDKVYTAEISFDVPVLTRDSTPAKRLTDAPKLANSGTLTLGNKTYKMSNVVAYEMKQFDEPVTAVVLSEKPLNMTKLKAALGKKSIDDYFEFVPQIKLVVDSSDKVSGMSIWVDNTSISGTADLDGDVVIEDGRARGIGKMKKPGEFFEKKYSFEVSFDVEVLRSSPAVPKADAGGLVADSYDGFPIPDGRQNISSEGSKFRKEIKATVPAPIDAVVRFYRTELASGGWKENAQAAKVDQRSAKLSFSGPSGSLIVQLQASGKDTAITLSSRDAQAAKAAGMLPPPGKGRLLIGNASDEAVTITVNKKDYSVAAGAGAQDPQTGINWEVAPGKYTVEVKLGGKVQTEVLTVGADETWGVIVIEAKGFLPVQLY
jgi:hypothetical protein